MLNEIRKTLNQFTFSMYDKEVKDFLEKDLSKLDKDSSFKDIVDVICEVFWRANRSKFIDESYNTLQAVIEMITLESYHWMRNIMELYAKEPVDRMRVSIFAIIMVNPNINGSIIYKLKHVIDATENKSESMLSLLDTLDLIKVQYHETTKSIYRILQDIETEIHKAYLGD